MKGLHAAPRRDQVRVDQIPLEAILQIVERVELPGVPTRPGHGGSEERQRYIAEIDAVAKLSASGSGYARAMHLSASATRHGTRGGYAGYLAALEGARLNWNSARSWDTRGWSEASRASAASQNPASYTWFLVQYTALAWSRTVSRSNSSRFKTLRA